MRLFVAVRVNDEVRAELGELQRILRKEIREARIVPPSNIHLTVKFLGETCDEVLARVEQLVAQVAGNTRPFVLRVKGAGHFPDGKNARVFWAGAESSEAVLRMHRSLDSGAEQLGYPRDTRFSEHITVARFTGSPHPARLAKIEQMFADRVWGSVPVTGVELVRSVLKQDGPEYITVRQFTLGGGDGQGQGTFSGN